MKEMQKIGILGGTFNPIHIGHLIMAQSAYEMFGLDKVWIMPSGNPPHKKEQLVLDKETRVQMVQLAIQDNQHFQLSREEIDYEGYVYTADTLERLKKKYPQHEYYFILGADSLFYFDQWKEPDRICRHCKILTASRNLKKRRELEQKITELQKMLEGEFLILDTPTLEVSSADIRNRVENGKSIRYLVPDSVEQYIYEYDLYS